MPLALVKYARTAITIIANTWRFLRLRLSLATVAILLGSIWGMVWCVSTTLRQDLERTLGTVEALGPVHQFQQQLIGTASVVSGFAVLLVWLLLKHQLEPLALVAAELRLRAGTRARYYPLEVVRSDEIGVLVKGFNALLCELQNQEYAREDADTALEIAAELQDRTGEIAQVGGWQVDLESMKLTWTRETFRIAEMQGTVEPPFADGVKLFATEARPAITAAIQAAMKSGKPYDLELPIVGAMGTHKWVRIQGASIMWGDRAVRLHGTIQDISQRKPAETQVVLDALQGPS